MSWIEIGVTGTRSGATRRQLLVATDLAVKVYREEGPIRLHQGCCVGFDEEITEALRKAIPADDLFVRGYPPSKHDHISWRAVELCDELMTPAGYLVRDRRIVRNGKRMLIGAPKNYLPQKRGSGTWYTMQHAYDNKRELQCVYPSGAVRNGFDTFRGATRP